MFIGHVSHGDERHRRHIRGKKRAALADKLEKRSAIVIKLEMLAKKDEEVLLAGNLNETLDILHKISMVLFSEKQIKCLATIYYYALLLPGNANVGSLLVAEFISSKHDVTTITHFLNKNNNKKNNMLHCSSVSVAAGMYEAFVKLFGNEHEINDFNNLVQIIKILLPKTQTVARTHIYHKYKLKCFHSTGNRRLVIRHLKQLK
ncbi:hypothetical protein ALC62_01345 [Cyphomyrmex costatus]|uniref:Uncharacterized protein n=1 Tax=Cyphomyrmex costatus TaxID=456900 RepID=A0A151IPA8_9HYME|nr:hypothetical protein ALC62_01345 [Cyphomyrmex costatus]